MTDDDGLKHWQVAGGVIIDDRGILLVANKRRNGLVDWSTPGGVVDPGETPLEALSREVREESGITVHTWSEAVYRVEVVAPDHGFRLDVTSHRAESFSGVIALDDPDQIVIAAEFVPVVRAFDWLEDSSPWVTEPLVEYLGGDIPQGHLFRYRLMGGPQGDRRVLRLHDDPASRSDGRTG